MVWWYNELEIHQECCELKFSHMSILFNIVIFAFLVSNVYFNCIVQGFLYYNMDVGTIWHCALVSCPQSQSVGMVLGVCYSHVPFTNSFFILFILTYIFRLSETRKMLFCDYETLWMFVPLGILFEYQIVHRLLACSYSLQRYSTGEFHALQLMVLVVVGAMD